MGRVELHRVPLTVAKTQRERLKAVRAGAKDADALLYEGGSVSGTGGITSLAGSAGGLAGRHLGGLAGTVFAAQIAAGRDTGR